MYPTTFECSFRKKERNQETHCNRGRPSRVRGQMHDLGVEPPEQWCCDAIVLSQPCYDLSDEDVFRKMSYRHFVSNDGNMICTYMMNSFFYLEGRGHSSHVSPNYVHVSK